MGLTRQKSSEARDPVRLIDHVTKVLHITQIVLLIILLHQCHTLQAQQLRIAF